MTMMALRDGLAENLRTIVGLNVSATVPDDPHPPVAIVVPTGLTFDSTFSRGMDEYQFSILLLVHRVDSTTGQEALDAYCNPSGCSSIKVALESDKTLSGSAFDLRVTEITSIGLTPVGDATYLSASFAVTVYAQ